jgi:hypothetical protein
VIVINWGLEEPDHLSSAANLELCPHHICKYVYSGAAKAAKEQSLKDAYKVCGKKKDL